MAALVCNKPGELAVAQRPRPVRGEGEALVAPRRVGICGTDYHIYEGNQPFLNYPRVMGHELAVEVVEAPSDSGLEIGGIYVVNPYISCGTCIACRKGKFNCCTKIAVLGVHRDGGMASLISIPVGNLVRAEGLSADECAMVEFLAIGAHAVSRAAVSSDDRVLLIGAGPIGLGAALFASLAGGAVTVIDKDAGRLDAAARLVPNCKTVHAVDDFAARLDAITDSEGFDVVFDATGSRTSIEEGFKYVTNGGRYVLVSVVKGDINFVDADFHRKEISLFGSRNALKADFERVIAAIKAGDAKSRDWITHRTSLSGAVQDLPKWVTDKTGLIKAVIEIS
ncbi:MAG: zinc-binding alcohol dehydrogenase family protein [Devosia sp.]